MNWKKSIIAFLLAILLVSCDGDYCIEAEEFDNDYVQVKSNPVDDGIYGSSYDHLDGGQIANWHETGLRSNGKPFLIQISGGFVPWYGSATSEDSLARMKKCNFCAKRSNVAGENCICYNNQASTAETGIDNKPIDSVDCSRQADQDDPQKCTCTTFNGRATDEGVFHFPLNFYSKDHAIKFPDDQGAACKYNGGMGLYLGLFGVSGGEMPIRVYHLFSENSVCPISRNSDGECKDPNGVDQTKYVFRSANNKIFVKDDLSGNNGTDANPADNTLHRPNEFIKLIIHDRYYSDNFGKYNVIFVEGVYRDGDQGLLEYIVSIVEDAILGKLNSDGEREGGIIEFMYKSIVQDSYFGAVLQVALSLYIAFFGFASLLGIVELKKKELLNRLLKLALIIFFTTPTSWYWYNQIIVGFFKEGMDVIIRMFSDFVVSNVDEQNSMLLAQTISDNPNGMSSRFSYIDTMIKTLFSANVTKKIWALFFESFFGFLYIAIIYSLIFYFLYVMLLIAMMYLVAVMKLVFALALGPIFIAFSLFGQTAGMFKKWLGFIGSRSLELIMLFLVLYTFVMFIDGKFVEMLHYRVCTQMLRIGIFSLFRILMAYVDGRGVVDWFHMFIVLGGMIFILQQIIGNIPTLAGGLVSIGGQGGGQGFGSAKGMLDGIVGLAKSAATSGLQHGGGRAFRALRFASRKSGLSGLIDKMGDKIPIRNPRTMLRDNIIDSMITQAKKHAAEKGMKEGTKEFDAMVRNFVFNNEKAGMIAWQRENKNKAALYDMSTENVEKRLQKKLEVEPLKKFLKDEAKKMRNSKDPHAIPLGKDAEAHLRSKARDWADKHLSRGSASIEGHLKDMRGFIHDKGKITDRQAAKAFAGNKDLQDKYLLHKLERKRSKGEDPTKTGRRFMRHVHYEEKRGGGFLDEVGVHTGKGWDPTKRVGWYDRWRRRDKFQAETDEGMRRAVEGYLKDGGSMDEKKRLEQEYQKKAADSKSDFYKRQLLGYKDASGVFHDGKLQKELAKIDEKRAYARGVLRGEINRDIAKRKEKLTDEEVEAIHAQLLREREELRKKYLEFAKDPDWSKVDEFGGLDAMRDGLAVFGAQDRKTLFEIEAQIAALGVRGDEVEDPAVAGVSAGPVQFGVANLQDAIGLQASNVGLGAKEDLSAQQQKEFATQCLVAEQARMKEASDRQRKYHEQEVEIAENEILQRERERNRHGTDDARKDEIDREIATFQAQVQTAQKGIDKCTTSINGFEHNIRMLEQS